MKRDQMKWREQRWAGIRLRVGWVGGNQLVLEMAVVCTGDERKREKSGVMFQDRGQVGPKDMGRVQMASFKRVVLCAPGRQA